MTKGSKEVTNIIKMTEEIKRDQVGNTNMPLDKARTKQSHPLYVWCFTLPVGLDPVDQLDHKRMWDSLAGYCKKFTFQVEMGNTTEYFHYQGVFSLKHKERFETVKNILGDKAHIEPCKNYLASCKYCSKVETRIAGPWTEQSNWVDIPVLNQKWQKELKKLLSYTPDYRSIIWVWESEGGVGKSMFSKYMAITEGALCVTSGSSKDISYMISNHKIIIFDFPRTQIERVNYGLIECLKNGLITSPKYETSTKVFNSPHILCFANSPPNVENMSKDRWVIYKIVNGELEADFTNYYALESPVLDIQPYRLKNTKMLLPF